MIDERFGYRRKIIFQLFIVTGIILILAFFTPKPASGQHEGLSITLARPSEGETYYAGPSTLLYRVPITGWVYSDKFDPTEIVVELNAYSEDTIIATLLARPRSDNSFIFYVTINPAGSDGQFPLDNASCADMCHLPGDTHLQPGRILLSITATDPDGNQVTENRNVFVDLSKTVNIPVEVVLADDPDVHVEGVQISAGSWLYLWRSRFGQGETGSSGIANVPVEVLSQAPTRYIFRVEPTIVDGVLYQSDEFAQVILSPAANSFTKITLRVTRHEGNLQGRLIPSDNTSVASTSVWAMHVPEARVFHTLTSVNGEFTFSSLPLGEYALIVDNEPFIDSGFFYPDQGIEIAADTIAEVSFTSQSLEGRLLKGLLRDETGNPLPFAWISTTQLMQNTEVLPHTGQFSLENILSDEIRLFVRAPGYYSQFSELDLSSTSLDPVEFTLKRQAGTSSIPWGNGEIIIPVETQIRYVDQRFVVERGWIWGWGGEIHPTALQVGQFDILVSEGVFALEYLPGERALLYVISGRAYIRDPIRLEPIIVNSNQMLNLNGSGGLSPIEIQPFVLDHFRSGSESPLNLIWEPTIAAVVRDRLTKIGTGAAQAITLITYSLAVISLVAVPLFGLFRALRKKNS